MTVKYESHSFNCSTRAAGAENIADWSAPESWPSHAHEI